MEKMNKLGQTKKPRYKAGTSVSKIFYDDDTGMERPFTGKVMTFNHKEKVYLVKYEDGDEEAGRNPGGLLRNGVELHPAQYGDFDQK